MNTQSEEAISNWWNRLQDNSGGKARLKRCQTPEEAALLPETFSLGKLLPWLPIEARATIAGVSAYIKKSSSKKKFGEALATPKEKNGRVPLSESRFRQLLSARDWQEVYRSLRRVVTILDGDIDLIQFVETIILWSEELQGKYREPGKGLKFKLSQDYYTIAMKYEK